MAVVTTVETFGFGGLMDRIRGHKKRMSPENRTRAAVAGANMAYKVITAEMAIPKSGIKWSNLPRRSSNILELPATQSGQLAREMLVGIVGDGEATLTAVSPQAWWMEFGFMTKDGMFHIRPFMRPGIDKHRGEIQLAMKMEMMK